MMGNPTLYDIPREVRSPHLPGQSSQIWGYHTRMNLMNGRPSPADYIATFRSTGIDVNFRFFEVYILL